jgi:hypothetical protein
MTATRELVTNDILVTWNDGGDTPGSLLSSLNICLEFLTAYDRYLAHSAGWDCELNLVLQAMEERGFRFSLTCRILPSTQLFLGEGDAYDDILSWLKLLHEELLSRMLDFRGPQELDSLMVASRTRALEFHLDRELLFTLDRSDKKLAILERKYNDLLNVRKVLDEKVTLKIIKN